MRDRLTRAEVLNRRLNEDIDFMRKHGPLVEERLQTEEEIMKHIRATESQVCLFGGPEINETQMKERK